jgi:regulator of cell morphogenesis and NO signaling
MFWKENNNNMEDDSYVTDIVTHDYRASYVFQKYNIDYCCGGKLPLRTVCEIRGLEPEKIKRELAETMRTIQLSSSINYQHWSIDFLIDYIINVHHSYLTATLPQIIETVERFVSGHKVKYPYLSDLLDSILNLRDELIPHIEQENQVIFPYIKQIVHAYESGEPYASLLVRTLRKPIEKMVTREDQFIGRYIRNMRQVTNNFTPPGNSCITHKVAFAKLKELDQDIVQHVHLENNILFPRAIAMEQELLEKTLS